MKVRSFNQFLKDTEAIFKMENDIIADKLKQGVNGLEWLIMQVVIDDDRKESLSNYVRILEVTQTNKEQLFIDAAFMDHESFYEKHELNWWIAFDEALTYFSILKKSDYERYFDIMQTINLHFKGKLPTNDA
ncbi:hypothetical protein DCC39_07515 [Pueribacillus theae]|uniref:Uncharacterized protein n=1 Tax=Pueribacillus theae TaxID=2171751 RepID=A0A2U1K4L2_9BACI|nr:hypothetical protein [Pueribacillus theae]PWA12089.1 hypothetical protein DCC39_07515 [Pueribacillus theae]